MGRPGTEHRIWGSEDRWSPIPGVLHPQRLTGSAALGWAPVLQPDRQGVATLDLDMAEAPRVPQRPSLGHVPPAACIGGARRRETAVRTSKDRTAGHSR